MEIEPLIQKAKKGDANSFSQAIFLVKERAYRIAYSYLHDESSSMDAVCDAVEKAYRNLPKLREPHSDEIFFGLYLG